MDEELQQQAEDADRAYRERCPNDLMLFLRGLFIPSADGRQLFDLCISDFQIKTFEEIIPAIVAVRNGEDPPGKKRFWIERTKKASKDADLAALVLWLCAFPTRPLYIQVAAADKDQAAIIKRRIHDLLFYNRWLEELVELNSFKVKHKLGLCEIDIIAADIAGSHGETPDVLIVNELSHVTKWEFVENLLSNAAGVRRGLVVVATNAGFKNTKAWTWRQNAMTSPEWSCHILSRPAPWHSETNIKDEQKRTMPGRFMRLWWGVWASGKGDALDEAALERVFRSELKPLTAPEPGWRYLAGLDLGVSHDHAAVVVVGVHQELRIIKTAVMRFWVPPAGGEIDLIAIQDAVDGLNKVFRFVALFYDPYQAVLMAQTLRKRGVVCREMAFTPKNLDAMATALLQVIKDRTFQSYDDGGRLRADFGKFNLVEKTYGHRLESVSDESGHADVGTALVILLPAAVEMLEGGSGLGPEDDLFFEDDNAKELTKQEVAEMPPELRSIYESADDDLKRAAYQKRVKISEMDYFDHEFE